jgi:hypothetical protein
VEEVIDNEISYQQPPSQVEEAPRSVKKSVRIDES